MQMAVTIYTALFAALFIGTSLAVVLVKLLDKDFDPDSAYDLSYLDELDKDDWDAVDSKNDGKATAKEEEAATDHKTHSSSSTELPHLGDMTF